MSLNVVIIPITLIGNKIQLKNMVDKVDLHSCNILLAIVFYIVSQTQLIVIN